MSTIVTRAGKGSQLSWTEVDTNFTNLNTDKIQSSNAGSTGNILTKTADGAEWAAPASGGFPMIAIRHTNAYTTTISGNLRRVNITETADTGNLISISSNQFTMPAGTYIAISPSCNATTISTFYGDGFFLYNVTDSETIMKTSFDNYEGTSNYWAQPGVRTFTLAASKTLELRANTTTSTFPSQPTTTTGFANGQSEWVFIKIA